MYESLFQHSREALHRRVGNDVILARPDREDFDVLSSTAAATWELLETPRTASDLLNLLGSTYGVPPEAIAADVGALLDDLLRRGWIEEVHDDHP